jgi:hypothetical protein
MWSRVHFLEQDATPVIPGGVLNAKPLRADAQANQDRIPQAAARAFTKEGADTSFKASWPP